MMIFLKSFYHKAKQNKKQDPRKRGDETLDKSIYKYIHIFIDYNTYNRHYILLNFEKGKRKMFDNLKNTYAITKEEIEKLGY